MWNDNETNIDLLGFGDLVDSLDYLLRQRDLLPLTVGVLGDWGSGKSSLMRLAQASLDKSVDRKRDGTGVSQFITVAFSPWRFEDFTQVKIALMDAVMSAIEERVKDLPEDSTPRKKLALVKKYFGRFRRFKPVAAPMATGAATGVGALLGLPLPPEALAIIASGAAASTEGGLSDQDREKIAASFSSAEQDALKSISEFHVAFEELLDSIEDVQAVVVFIDDMDRCEERAIIDTFETIRLFLNATKTAYVLGINEQIVISALEDRYPNRGGDNGSRAQQYLEKMMQASVVIPRLSEAEARSYISLLYASKHLGDDAFDKLVEKADERRVEDPYGEAMNIGVVLDVLDGAMGDELKADLEVAAAVAGPLSDGLGLRGNPRQLKRFLNKLETRLELARKRDLDITPQVLAKLMVLEELSFTAFEQLFIWQAENQGVAPHLELAEAQALDQKTPRSKTEVKTATRRWADQPTVASWLHIEPRLAKTPLTTYFTLSRDQLKTSLKTASMSPAQQAILGSLRAQVDSVREAAVEGQLESPSGDLLAVASVLVKEFRGAMTSEGSKSLLRLAAKHDGIRADLLVELGKVPAKSLTWAFILDVSANLGKFPEFIVIAKRWKAGLKPESQEARALDVQLKKVAGD